MLKRTEPDGEEAVVRYGDHDVTVLRPGRFVRCAVTGAAIPLEELRYWNADLQEAYCSVEIAHARWKELQNRT